MQQTSSMTMTNSSASLRGAALRAAAPRARSSAARQPMRIDALAVGDKAPEFSLADQRGKTVSLKSLKKPLVLYFYPKDNTPGCTREAKAFRDSFAEFKAAGATVVGISSDSVESHQEFQSDLELPFALLSDEGGEVRKAYEVKKDLFGLLDGRQTFVIGKDGTVKMAFNDQFGPEKHVDKALDAVLAEAPAKFAFSLPFGK